MMVGSRDHKLHSAVAKHTRALGDNSPPPLRVATRSWLCVAHERGAWVMRLHLTHPLAKLAPQVDPFFQMKHDTMRPVTLAPSASSFARILSARSMTLGSATAAVMVGTRW